MLKRKLLTQISNLVVFGIFFLCSLSHGLAQIPNDVKENLKIPDEKEIQIITTHDKSTIIGRIVEIKEKDIQFKTEFGVISIPVQNIKSIEIVPSSSIKDGKYWFPNPNATRLYFGPTGRMLKKGDGYFADYYLFFPAFAYSLSNIFAIGGGMSLIPGLNPDKQIFYFTPKIGLKATENLNIATGALIIRIPDYNDDDDDDDDGSDNSHLVGVVYGVGTIGITNESLTIGLGYGFVDDKLAEKPLIILGGEKRISRRLSLVTENWLLPGVNDPLISYGMRFMGEKMSVDLALLNTLGKDIFFPGLPYVDFVFNF